MSANEVAPPLDYFIDKSGATLVAGKILIPEYVTSIKFDIGLSCNAPQSKVWIEANPKALVFGFEPLSKNIKMISEGTSDWPIRLNPRDIGRNIFILPIALSSTSLNHKLKMKIADQDSGCSSLLDSLNLLQSTSEYVPVFKLDDFMDYLDFKRIRFIEYVKIDAQGMDFEIIRGTKKYLKKICFLTAEMDLNYLETTNSTFKLNLFMLLRGFLRIGKISSYFLHKIFCLTINVDDPTYINLRLVNRINKNFFIYQKG
jgi:FkbM family methyltransferase